MVAGVKRMYRIAVIEDDTRESDSLRSLLSAYAAAHGVAFSADVYHDASSFLAVGKGVYDIVFMDIGLPDMSGMEAAKRLREKDESAVLIFVTSMANFAVRGYEANALDFIVKPVGERALDAALSRALKLLCRRTGIDIAVGVASGLRMLSSSGIHYVEVRDHLIVYHTDEGEITEFGSLKKPERLLEAHGFIRCNNSTLVNLRYIGEVTADSVTVDGAVIPISRSRGKGFIKALNAYLGV